MRYFLIGIASLILAACSVGTPITDFEKRGIYYTWVDAGAVSGNKMAGFQVRNLSVPQNERYYQLGWEKLGKGFLVWHYGVKPGRYEFDKMWMQSCAGPICTNTINEYSFGRLGSGIGSAMVKQPGQVVFGGCYAFKRTKRGFFRPGEFDTRKSACGVSKSQMMAVLMKHAKHPINKQRLQAAR